MTDPLQTTDALQWATEWCLAAKLMKDDGKNLVEVGWMMGWFANAIEVAKSDERRRLLGLDQKGPHRFEQILQKGAANRTDVDKALVAAIMLISTQVPYAYTMSALEVFDHFVKEHDRIYG